MSHFDLPLDELRRYRPDVAVPDDLDEFWRETLAQAHEFDLAARFTPVDTGLVAVETFDVTFAVDVLHDGSSRDESALHFQKRAV